MKALRFVLMLVLIVLACAPMITPTGASEKSLEQISKELMALEPYVQRDESTGQQTFDAASARKNGVAEDIVLLAEELVAFQNELVRVSTAGQAMTTVSVDPYPRVKELMNLATQKARGNAGTDGGSPDGVSPCGQFGYPVPNYTPPRPRYGPVSNPRQTLLNKGYHQTAFYACFWYSCPNDFTKGRSYSGPYGYCSSPRFRNQGTTSDGSRYYNIQSGEPNPEIHSYGWPYWNWGVYCFWWHQTY